jgi:RNA polymerase sigma-70 factor (ECF subfamily)
VVPLPLILVSSSLASLGSEIVMNLDVYLPAILERDTHAFGQWMAGAEGTIRESLRSFARVVDVEAVLQEALLRVWQVAPRFVPDGSPNGLLRLGIRIARNLAISEVRRTKARPTSEDELENALALVASSDPEMPDPFLREVLVKCYELLPEQPRRVLQLRIASSGEADDQLAQTIGMRLNTFLQNFGRARKLIGECLRKNGVTIDEGLVT